MSLFDDLPGIASENEPMALHTSFRVGGPVRYFLEPRDWRDIEAIYDRSWDAGLRVRVLGRGCNTLVTDGPHGWSVVSTRRLAECCRRGSRVEAGAGLDLRRLVSRAEGWGLGGFAALAGIPGTVGGAVAMNAGGRYGSIADRLVSAVVALPGEGIRSVTARDLGLAYRRSNLVDGTPFLLSASFELDRASPGRLRELRRSIVAEKCAAQPMGARSAGCVFRNPPGQSAGRLIDQAGLKGMAVGDAVVSHKHANFIINRGEATAADILRLIDLVTERVQKAFGIRLELEIEVWSDTDERGHHGKA